MNHIEYIKRYQAWRTGELDMTMDEAGIAPAELTNAINKVIADAERYRFIRDGDQDILRSSGDDLLTDSQMEHIWDSTQISFGREKFRVSHYDFSVAIQKAVLLNINYASLRLDADRLDSRCIRLHDRNEMGEEYMVEHRGVNLRDAIDAAIKDKA